LMYRSQNGSQNMKQVTEIHNRHLVLPSFVHLPLSKTLSSAPM
jgi:hypothetical protein